MSENATDSQIHRFLIYRFCGGEVLENWF